jgi:transposase
MIRMLLIGYCLGIRSERRLCEELHLNLAYRWFCGLGLEGRVQTTRRSRKAVMAASAIAISCAICSRRCWRVH